MQDRGTTEIRDTIKLSRTRPYLVKDQAYIVPKKSVFNKIVGDINFELEFASFLDGCDDIVSFVKNSQSTNFRIEYRNADGSIANYYPGFHRQADRGGNLDHRNKGPGRPGRSGQVGAAATVVRRRDRA